MRLTAYLTCVVSLSISAAWSAPTELASHSIYHLKEPLISQSGVHIGLDVHSGHPVLITMFYSSCPAACPLLIDNLRAVERTLDAQQRSRLRVLMISVDPVRDTPGALAHFATERHLDLSRWTLVHAEAPSVRRIAAMLSIQYRQLPNGDFNHSSIVSVLSPQGEIIHQSSVTSSVDTALLAALTPLLQKQ